METSGAIAQRQLPADFFNKWHTLCLTYANSKLVLIVDGVECVFLNVNLDFLSAYNRKLIFGCLQTSNERQNFFNGAIANIEMLSTDCNNFYAQQYHSKVLNFS